MTNPNTSTNGRSTSSSDRPELDSTRLILRGVITFETPLGEQKRVGPLDELSRAAESLVHGTPRGEFVDWQDIFECAGFDLKDPDSRRSAAPLANILAFWLNKLAIARDRFNAPEEITKSVQLHATAMRELAESIDEDRVKLRKKIPSGAITRLVEYLRSGADGFERTLSNTEYERKGRAKDENKMLCYLTTFQAFSKFAPELTKGQRRKLTGRAMAAFSEGAGTSPKTVKRHVDLAEEKLKHGEIELQITRQDRATLDDYEERIDQWFFGEEGPVWRTDNGEIFDFFPRENADGREDNGAERVSGGDSGGE